MLLSQLAKAAETEVLTIRGDCDIRSMSLSQGASTITQQLIKLTQLSPEKTLTRKVREAAMALRLRGEEMLAGRGDYADHMLYDLWANAVLESAASDLRVALKREFRDRGFFVTPTWSPGQNGIALSNQAPFSGCSARRRSASPWGRTV